MTDGDHSVPHQDRSKNWPREVEFLSPCKLGMKIMLIPNAQCSDGGGLIILISVVKGMHKYRSSILGTRKISKSVSFCNRKTISLRPQFRNYHLLLLIEKSNTKPVLLTGKIGGEKN